MDVNILRITETGENAFIYNTNYNKEALLIVLMNFLLVSNPVRPRILKHVFKSNFFGSRSSINV